MNTFTEQDFIDLVNLSKSAVWHPIATAPMDDGVEILTWDGASVRVAIHAWDDKWQTPGLPAHTPTHWKPLPTPPEAA
jgi:hypothetical protein